MAIVDIPDFALLPTTWNAAVTSAVFNSTTAAKRGALFEIPKSGTITHLGVGITAVTTSQLMKMSLQTTVDTTTFYPSGTLLSGSNAAVFTPIVGTNWVTCGNTNVNVGELQTIVLEWDSTAGSVSMGYVFGTSPYFFMGLQYNATNSTWAKSVGSAGFMLRYSDGSEYAIGQPIIAQNTVSWSNSGNPLERGNRFRLACSSRLCGWWYVGQASGGNNFQVTIYDDSDTILLTKTYDSDITEGSANLRRFRFDSPITLLANTWYRIAVKPITANNWNTRENVYHSTAIMQNMEGGADFYMTTRPSGGSWTDTPTSRMLIVPCFNGVDTGSGGGTTILSIPTIKL